MPTNKLFFTTEEELKRLSELAAMHCSITEMAHIFGCTREVFYKRPELMEIIDKAKNETKMKLRKLMIKRALYDGDDEYLLSLSQKALEHCHKWYLDHRDTAVTEETKDQNTFLPPVAELDDKSE